EQQCGRRILKSFGAGKTQPQAGVEQSGCGDDEKTCAKGQRKPEPKMGNQKRGYLPKQGKPAQFDKGVDAKPARASPKVDVGQLGHNAPYAESDRGAMLAFLAPPVSPTYPCIARVKIATGAPPPERSASAQPMLGTTGPRSQAVIRAEPKPLVRTTGVEP